MPTTVHIPAPLLYRVDARAKTLGISRNRLVIEALEEKLTPRDRWPPELVRLLSTPVRPDVAAAADQGGGRGLGGSRPALTTLHLSCASGQPQTFSPWLSKLKGVP